MKELLRTNDPVLLSYVSALLEEGGHRLYGRRSQHERARGLDRSSSAARFGRETTGSRKRATSSPRPASAMSSPTTKKPGPGRRRPAAPRPTISSAVASASFSRGPAIVPVAMPCFSPLPSPAKSGERVLDIGAGVGVAGLCLLARVPGVQVTAVEIDAGLCALAAKNAARNGFAARYGDRRGRRDLARQRSLPPPASSGKATTS